MIEAMRDIGYSLESAVADIIDNSITARASVVDVRFGWRDGAWIGIIDDGDGMSAAVLREAMRPGVRNPLEQRSTDDLGRFGLGLKTASFSQCRRLTVLTRRNGVESAARWDLDYLAETDRWTLQRPSDAELALMPCFSELGPQGTLVMWEKIDRLEFDQRDDRAHQQLNEQMGIVREHVARVFHRFIGGERGFAKLTMRLNLAEVPAFDPFNEASPATQALQEERVVTKTGDVRMQAYVLPHHSKVAQAEYHRLAGTEGYLRNQGFYVYRNRRLIVWGTWFRLAPQEELTKLARVKVDIPNTQDQLWCIDVRKSRACPPAAVRARMKQIVERIRSSAKRPYTHRGTPVSSGPKTAVWQRRVFNEAVRYEVNTEHPLVADLRADLDQETRARLDAVLRMVGEAFPAAIFFSDYATNPRALEPTTCDVATLVALARLIAAANPGFDQKGLTALLGSIEPFAAWPNELDKVARIALQSRT
ncbi:ATP-binding protein [Roseateles sp. BYS180W]|uniref:ATP-binding protein n=1 Tax=Roseateles rivi TaxID=3299028 RepID=A0ABW7FYR5_9BURK